MKKILPLLLLTPINANAECTPAPDCASIGYTQTSCETLSLKCPFDTSKLFCLPCDSSFQYTCDASNEYGDGESCGNKYQSCCNTDCIVGAIYYSDGSCSTCFDDKKQYLGVIIKENELLMSVEEINLPWGGYGTDISTITNFKNSSQALQQYNGQATTSLIVSALASENSSTSAAHYCNEYAPAGMTNSKGKWYLPSLGELFDYIYANALKLQPTYEQELGWNTFNVMGWSTTEWGANNVWAMFYASGGLSAESYGIKTQNRMVNCFYRF